MNTKLVKYVYAFCVDNGLFGVWDFNIYGRIHTELKLPHVSELSKEGKEIDRMLAEREAILKMKSLVKQTGWFKANLYLLLLKVGNWLRGANHE